MSTHSRPRWDRAEVDDIERRLEGMRRELANSSNDHRQLNLQQCISVIETMLPVYRQFAQFFDAVEGEWVKHTVSERRTIPLKS